MPTQCQLNANSMPTQCQLNANSMPTQCQLNANFKKVGHENKRYK
jgi:hypothetical protein